MAGALENTCGNLKENVLQREWHCWEVWPCWRSVPRVGEDSEVSYAQSTPSETDHFLLPVGEDRNLNTFFNARSVQATTFHHDNIGLNLWNFKPVQIKCFPFVRAAMAMVSFYNYRNPTTTYQDEKIIILGSRSVVTNNLRWHALLEDHKSSLTFISFPQFQINTHISFI